MGMLPGKLLLETGEFFFGQVSTFQENPCFGEVVFNTGMAGYVESLTDPSYAGQILVFTYPLIGNYGVSSPHGWESPKIHVQGVVMSEAALHYSSHTAIQSLIAWLQEERIPYLVGADTRAITTHLRTRGVVPGFILKEGEQPEKWEDHSKRHWVNEVSIKEPCFYGEGEKQIILVDCGVKENIIRCLLQYPVRIKRVPHDYDYSDEPFDGILLSNGPGDPAQCTETIRILQKVMTKEITQQKPIFGICLGTQMMALAVGAKTYKLPFGHRSQNQPCMDLESQRCYLTSQNHSYAVDEKTLPADWQVIFRNLNDQSVEGIAHKQLSYFAVQFHPEAAPGPCDSQWLFQRFYESLSIKSDAHAL